MKYKNGYYLLAGALAGLVNGLFGAGGGLVLVPLYRRADPQHPRVAFATSVAVIAPLCAVSFLLMQARQPTDLAAAAPYLLGGALGGFCSGPALRRLPVLWLRRLFGLFLLYGGVRALLPR